MIAAVQVSHFSVLQVPKFLLFVNNSGDYSTLLLMLVSNVALYSTFS